MIYIYDEYKCSDRKQTEIVSIIEIKLIMETITIVSRYNAMHDSNQIHFENILLFTINLKYLFQYDITAICLLNTRVHTDPTHMFIFVIAFYSIKIA